MNTSNKVKFITASDRQGEVVLKYLNKTCQQALNYCQKNNLQSYEDFARTIKVIGDRNAKSKGEHLAIRVGVKENDLVLSLANRPQLGTTKSIKMLEHLGKGEKYQYTRSTIEGSLQKKSVKENIEFNSQELSDFSENENKFSQGKKNSRLDVVDLIEDRTVSASKEVPEDLLFEVESAKTITPQENDAVDELLSESVEDVSKEQNLSNSEKKQPQSESDRVKPDVVVKKTNKKSQSKSSFGDRASKTLMALGRKADSYTQDTDGMTVMATSLKMGAVGIAFANKLLEKREEKKLKATIDRILAAQERTSQLVERSKSIKQKAEEPEIDSELDLDDELDADVEIESDDELDLDDELELDDELDLEKDISEQLNNAVKTIDRQLIDVDPDITTEPIVIDRSADFYQQLEQINAALERLEQKLDSLEERIEHLEQLLDKRTEEKRDDVELDSEEDLDSDVWDEDQSTNQSDEEAEDLDTRLVNVLLDVNEKYEQINPNSESGIPIGDSCRLCSDKPDGMASQRANDRTVITIEEQDGEEVEEIFKATIESDSGEFEINKDELDEDEKQAIVESFSQKLNEIDDFLEKQQKQTQSKPNQPKKQKEIAMVD